MAQFKITKYGFQGNVTGSLEGTASHAKNATSASIISTNGSTGQVWAMTSATTQGWSAAAGGSTVIMRTY